MSFVDKVKINVQAGRGGDGRRSFRRERFISRGGPDGGDGGNGGDVILKTTASINTLSAFRRQKEFKALDGQPGGKSRKHGKSGQSLIVKVPVGTEVSRADDQVLADLVAADKQVVIAKGGRGGFGNAHFTSSTRQAPNFAEKGESGQKLELSLELKLIADIGIVGLPNVGKSTLLSRLSNARPEIADYPFTTLTPNLGVVDVDDKSSFLMADIPGLIEGAATGKGLGHEFLRHIERTRLIVHLIDIYEPSVKKSYQVVRGELKAYSDELTKLPQIVVLNKIDGYDLKSLDEKIKELKSILPKSALLLAISAQAGTNLNELKFSLKKALDAIQPPKKETKKPALPRITLSDESETFEVKKVAGGFRVIGPKIETFGQRTDFNNQEAIDRLKNILKRTGILHELLRQGLTLGDRIYIGEDSHNFFIF